MFRFERCAGGICRVSWITFVFEIMLRPFFTCRGWPVDDHRCCCSRDIFGGDVGCVHLHGYLFQIFLFVRVVYRLFRVECCIGVSVL